MNGKSDVIARRGNSPAFRENHDRIFGVQPRVYMSREEIAALYSAPDDTPADGFSLPTSACVHACPSPGFCQRTGRCVLTEPAARGRTLLDADAPPVPLNPEQVVALDTIRGSMARRTRYYVADEGEGARLPDPAPKPRPPGATPACTRCGATEICARCDSLLAEAERQQRPVAPAPPLVCSDCQDVRKGVQPGTVCWQPNCYGVLRLGWAK